MALLVPNIAEKRLLHYLRDHLVTYPPRLRLFQGDLEPDEDTTLELIDEATFSGYSPILLPSWSEVYGTPEGKAEVREVIRIFRHNGGGISNAIYGYYVTSQAGFLLWIERHANAPHTLSMAGDEYPVLPKLTLRSEDP